jgi:hypothetical protein
MEALGRIFNVVPVASGVHIKMNLATGVTFVVYEVLGTTSITVQESIAGASAQNLTRTRYATSNGVGTSQVWTSRTQAASATVSKADATDQNCVVFHVWGPELSAGFDCVKCVVDGSATCMAILHDLNFQYTPANLPTPA